MVAKQGHLRLSVQGGVFTHSCLGFLTTWQIQASQTSHLASPEREFQETQAEAERLLKI